MEKEFTFNRSLLIDNLSVALCDRSDIHQDFFDIAACLDLPFLHFGQTVEDLCCVVLQLSQSYSQFLLTFNELIEFPPANQAKRAIEKENLCEPVNAHIKGSLIRERARILALFRFFL